MKKIVLQDLPADVQQLIEMKCTEDGLSAEAAVLQILDDAATDFAIQHDIALLESWNREDHPERHNDGQASPHHGCSGNVRHLVVCCHGSLHFG